METKFKKGDLVKIRTTGDIVMVIEYRINYAGDVMNAVYKSKKFNESIITDEVLCEGEISRKFQRKYIKEANLELYQSAQ